MGIFLKPTEIFAKSEPTYGPRQRNDGVLDDWLWRVIVGFMYFGLIATACYAWYSGIP